MNDLQSILKRIEYNFYAAEALGNKLTWEQHLHYEQDISKHRNLEYWLAKSISMTWEKE